jgi:glucokinase
MDYLLGIDIGGTKCAVVLGGKSADGELRVARKMSFKTPANAPQQTIERLADACRELAAQEGIGLEAVAAVGISCGGPLDAQAGLILSPPNLIGWDAIAVVDLLSQNLGRKVYLQNDANACALAEWQYGAGKGLTNLVFLTFGTGMGAGLILNGQLYSGTNDMAGEVGHIRLEASGPVGYGKAGSFEAFCSGGGIAQLAGILALEKLQMGEKVAYCACREELAQIDARVVGEYAERGDPLALEVYRLSGHYLGKGLAVLIDILNPQGIIIGSIFNRRMDLLWQAAEQVIEREALQRSRCVCKVMPSGLGESIGDFAALAVADYGSGAR